MKNADQEWVDCVNAHYPNSVTTEDDANFIMQCLLSIANETYFIGHMTNDDGQAYGRRYSPELPNACRVALSWSQSAVDQSSKLWDQWTTKPE